MPAAYLRREIGTDPHTAARTFHPHVTVWDNGSRLDDIDLDPASDNDELAAEAAGHLRRAGWTMVTGFIAPPWHRPLGAPDELDHRAEVAPTPTFYGGCGIERCDDCHPLFDADNVPIPGTDVSGPLPADVVATYGIEAQ